jgi:hypothetical protein
MPDAPAKPVSPEVEALWAELDSVTDALNQNKGQASVLYSQRSEVIKRLLDAGERQAEIARRAKVTSTAIGLAAGKSYKRGED